MRKFLLSTLCLLMPVLMVQADEELYLNVDGRADIISQLEVDSVRKIAFEGETMLITLYSGDVQQIPIGDVTKLQFTTVSGINEVLAAGNCNSETIRIVSLEGLRVYTQRPPLNTEILPPGIYIITHGNKIWKVKL